MAITELIKNKKYKIRVSYRDGYGKPRSRDKTINGTEKDAIIEERKLKDELTVGITRNMTFKDLFTAYHNSKPNIKDETKRKEVEIYNKFLLPVSNRKLENITPYNLIVLRNTIEAMDGSVTQKNKGLYLLKSIYKFGKRIFGIVNIAIDVETIKPKVREKFVYNTLTPEEFNEVLSFEKIEVYRLIYEIYFWAGLRRGEALALYKKDLLPSMELDIYNSINSRRELGPPKNESSYRRVKIHEELYTRLVPHANSKGTFLLGGVTNLAPNTVNRRFKECLEKANKVRVENDIDCLPNIRIHDLRHSHATFLASMNIPVTVVSARLGHSSISETMQTYIHLFKGDDDRALDAINNYINGTTIDRSNGVPLKSRVEGAISGSNFIEIESVFNEIINDIKQRFTF